MDYEEKYIDADLLRKEIEKRKTANQQDATESGAGAFYEDKAILDLLDFLQQEQPCDTCTNDKGCVTCKNGELWEGKEQPCEDFENEYEKFHLAGPDDDINDNYTFPIDLADYKDFARHFYELGKKNK